MTERFMDEDVRTRLVLSGITELEEHGVRDFSLRRSAEAAGVSCAAPYRYFKSKEEYIGQIFSYLASKWELMFNEINEAYQNEPKKLIIELCMANIRFWLANRNLRSALLLSGNDIGGVKISDFDSRLSEKLLSFFEIHGFDRQLASDKTNAVRAILLGYVTLIGAGELLNNSETIDSIKRVISESLLLV